MAKDKPEDEPQDSTAAGTAAVAEVEAEKAPEDAIVTVEFNGETYTFKRKRLRSIQFLKAMQDGRDLSAVEWLLGAADYGRFVRTNADDDGCTSNEIFLDFIKEIGKAAGAPN